MMVTELVQPIQKLFPQYRIDGVPISGSKLWAAWFLSFLSVVGGNFLSTFANEMLRKKVTFSTAAPFTLQRYENENTPDSADLPNC
eukprot:NODE_2538_length_516_cov_35.107066_g2016_i0.p2 GENE.NODE_2538_length_516_cov_35.107066_g2016_i0~~NODE_2538_length_516_cov_35.107066_g2016_i0.p2  ORF type:complete len:86 (-),score=22.28 NODE_2538_length_516_cov_35.107066_g2016_i0:65-322(-)